MSLIRPTRAPILGPVASPFANGLPWSQQGGGGLLAPRNTVAPVASGTVTIGGTLTTTTGTWTGVPAPTFTYQWQRAGVNIAAATANTYTPVAADMGPAITCNVTATNAVGSTSAASNALTYAGLAASLTSLTCILDQTNQTGSPISAWSPSSGAFAGMTAAGAGQPAAGRTINSLASPDFDGTANVMTSTGTVAQLLSAAAYEYWIVFLADVVSSTGADVRQNHCLLGDTVDVVYCVLKSVTGTPTVLAGHFSGSLKTVSSATAISSAQIANVSFNGTTIRLSVNGGTDQTIAAGNVGSGAGTIRIGETTFGGVYFNGAYGCLVACQAQQSAGVRADATAYLKWKYGVA